MGAALYLLKEGWDHPGVSCLYIALTRQSARLILWKDCLKVIDRKLGLGCVFNETDLTCTLPNGSVIYLSGADADQNASQKFLGQKFRLAIIDEAASFRQDLSELVYGVLKPAMSDFDGTIVLIGTPGNIRRGLFYRITSGQPEPQDAKWSVHKWSQAQNPYMSVQFAAELAEIDRDRPLFKETNLFQQHYLGLWVVDDSRLVYRFDSDRNTYSSLPPANYRMVLGVDLGHSPDPSAFVLVAYQPADPTLYVIETLARTKMDFTAVAETIKDFQARYKIDQVIIDGANKQGVAEMCNRHGLVLTAADKREKAVFIDLLNDDFVQGRIKLFSGLDDILDEVCNLVWDDRAMARTGKRQEHAGCANHLCDALLYAWRSTYAYLAVTPPAPLTTGSKEWLARREAEWEAEAEARSRPRSDFDFPTDDNNFGDPYPN